MKSNVTDKKRAAKLSTVAMYMLDELGRDCSAAGLDALAHLIGVAAEQAREEAVRAGQIKSKTSCRQEDGMDEPNYHAVALSSFESGR